MNDWTDADDVDFHAYADMHIEAAKRGLPSEVVQTDGTGKVAEIELAVDSSEPEPGYWCTGCALPSAWLVVLTFTLGGGRPVHQRKLYCETCGWDDC